LGFPKIEASFSAMIQKVRSALPLLHLLLSKDERPWTTFRTSDGGHKAEGA
jgi:hypothetical protein